MRVFSNGKGAALRGLFKKEGLVDGNIDLSCNGRNSFLGVYLALRTSVFWVGGVITNLCTYT